MEFSNRPLPIDIVAAREYNYQYEDGKLIRATEAMVEFTNEMVTSKVIVNSIQYYHNAENMPPYIIARQLISEIHVNGSLSENGFFAI